MSPAPFALLPVFRPRALLPAPAGPRLLQPPRPRFLPLSPACRADVLALADVLRRWPGDIEEMLAETRAQRGADAAGALFLAAIVSGRRPPAELLRPIVPDLTDVDDLLPTLVFHAGGDRLDLITSLLSSEVLHHRRAAMLAYVATRLLGEAMPSRRLVSELRLLARRMETASLHLGLALCALGDRRSDLLLVGARHAARGRGEVAEKEAARIRDRLAAPLGAVPRSAPPQPCAGPLRRERIGRNDPCPCQSGKKHKRCCEGKAAAEADPPSPVRGLGLSEYRARIAEFLTPEQLKDLPFSELRKVPLGNLPAPHLRVALRRYRHLRRWEQVEEILVLLAARGLSPPEIDRCRDEVMASALEVGAVAVANRQLEAVLDQAHLGSMSRLGFTLLGPDSLPGMRALERFAAAALRGEDGPGLLDFGTLLGRHFPALSLLLARSGLQAGAPQLKRQALGLIEEARDRLLLHPGDPFRSVERVLDEAAQEDLRAQRERERQRAQIAALSDELRQAASRIEALEKERRAAPAEAPAPAPPPAEWEAERGRLLRKIGRLKVLIAAGRAEREELRGRLAVAVPAAAPAGPGAPPPEQEAREEDASPAPETAPLPEAGVVRRPLVPVFWRPVLDMLASVPAHIARETVRTLGELGAGAPAAWRGAKRIQSAAPAVSLWESRIGRQYRVIYRVEERTLEVLELIHRRDLESRLRHQYAVRPH